MGTRAKTKPPRARLAKDALFRHLSYKPHGGQEQVHASKARLRVLACGVRWGKSLCAAMEAVAAAMQPCERSMGWVVAPTYDLADKIFREVQLVLWRDLKHRVVTMRDNDKRIVLRNLGGGLSEIRGKSADNPVSLLGEGLDWVVVDEAARLKPAIWQSYLSQRLIDRNGWALLISTPRGKGWFYDMFRRGQGQDLDYKSWNAPSWQNPHLDAALIEAERDRLPERVFNQEYGGAFVEGSGAVFRFVREAAKGEFRAPQKDQFYFGGLDLARVEDFTVIVMMNRDLEVVFVDRFNRLDWAIQVARVQAAVERYNNGRLLVDSTGAGEPIYESLRAAGMWVEPYTFTARSKADLVNNLALLLEQRKILLPRPELWPEGIEELEAFEYSVTDAGNVSMSAPYGVHDDCVMALALAAWYSKAACRVPRIIRL